MAEKLLGSAIQSGTITTTQLSGALSSTISQGGGPKIVSLTYPGDDTAANSVGGQTVVVNGTGFQTNVQIYVNGNAVPSVTYTNANSVLFTTPSLNAATYPLYLTNTDDGGTAILIPGLQISGEPTWSTSATLPAQDADNAWNISLSATSDSNVSYSLASGSSLPSGISLAANGLISGTLSSPPNDDTTYNFTVLATDEENQDASRAFSVNVTVGEGVAFANTVLLLHGDGTNNQNNHTFLDSSNNNFTITRNGNATQGSFSPFSQTGWSGYFDGSGDYITSPNTSFLGLGTEDFTIEFWAYGISFPNTWNTFFDLNQYTAGILLRYQAGVDSLYIAGTAYNWSPTTNFPLNAWNHVALTRSSGAVKLFINGSSVLSVTNSSNLGSTSILRIGESQHASGQTWVGYVSNFRIVKSTALYTSNFTPPTAPLTNIANTSLLTLQSNRFIDNSNNNFTITRSGDVRIVPYSPFAPTSKYTTANVGGSGYFDGTGDYLTFPSITLNGAFTAEAWVYHQGSNNPQILQTLNAGSGAGSQIIRIRNGFQYADGFGASITGNVPVINSTWNHLAITRDSGGTIRLFTNGVLSNSATPTVTSVNAARISGVISNGNDTDLFTGYISDVRILTGTALYTTNFTPPTTLLEPVANTSLLCNFTNAGIFDSTAKNVLETVGDAKVNTSVVKYGTGSMYFDGTGDWLKSSIVPYMVFGSSDMTVEAWIYPTIVSGIRTIFDTRTSGSFGNESFTFQLSNNNLQVFAGSYSPNNPVANAGTISANTWSHVAFSRNSGNNSLFINGTRVANNSFSWNQTFVATNEYRIGQTVGIDRPFNGYIDDLRISRFARYTSDFTPPASAFKDR